MNEQEKFANICRKINDKYSNGNINDDDIEFFADVLTNTLGRDDLRKDCEDFSNLVIRINDDFNDFESLDEKKKKYAIQIRTLCNMYSDFKCHPFSQINLDDDAEHKEAEYKKRIHAMHNNMCLTVTEYGVPLASCRWENIASTDEVMDKLSVIIPLLPEEPEENENILAKKIITAMYAGNCGFDPFDDEREKICSLAGINCEVAENNNGVIKIGKDESTLSRKNSGNYVIAELADRTVDMEGYTVYSKEFYEKLTNEKIRIDELEEMSDEDKTFSFDKIDDIASDWHNRIGDVFAITGSTNVIGTKKALLYSDKN